MAEILIVDDDASVRELVRSWLESHGHRAIAAGDGLSGLAALEQASFDVVLCDVSMPVFSGVDLLHSIGENAAASPAAIMISAVEDDNVVNDAFSLGAYGYLLKPFTRSQMMITIENALRRRSAEIEQRDRRAALEAAVSERTLMLERAYTEAVQRLSAAAEMRDQETGRHITRMSLYSELLALELNLEPEKAAMIRLASPLHDIGKLGIPDAILRKPGVLTPEEQKVMRKHTLIGHEILAGSDSPLLQIGSMLALTHHEHFDGGGYPEGISGSLIPIEGRIAAVADVLDALTSDRVYRRSLSFKTALSMIIDGSGKQFDPDVVSALRGARKQLLRVYEEGSATDDSLRWQTGQSVVPRPLTTSLARAV